MEFLKFFTGAGMVGYKEWYASLSKPFFAPPDWLFGVAWGLIYPLIGLALGVALYLYVKGKLPRFILAVFALNLLANILFTPIQLGLKDNLIASADILVVLTTLMYLEVWAWRHSKLIFTLLLPYLLWGSFATLLLLSITALNW